MPRQEEVTDQSENEVPDNDEGDEDGAASFELPPGTLASQEIVML